MALNSETLKASIKADILAKLDILFADPSSPPSREDVWDAISEALADQFVSHVVANLEIFGIAVDSGTPIGTVITAGVPTAGDGGAGLKTTMLTATPGQTATQNNPGTGHVA
jgi:hypothetical protein